MSLFIETIKINNGRRINLDGHNHRMNFTRNRHFHEIRNLDLREAIEVPTKFSFGIVKCRVIYGRKIEKIEFEHYKFKNPRSFFLVFSNEIDYNYKFVERESLDKLYTQKKADDILIVKNGLFTDSYYANIALLKNGIWYSPKEPLLKGTFREKLIKNKKIVLKDIPYESIYNFEKIKIFNAMTEWEMHQPVDINTDTIY